MTADDFPPSRDERKLVTSLVIGIIADPDSTAGDPEEARARIGGTMAHAAARIRHYGGVVQTTDMGRLLAVFGADSSHEDDPERAVRAALEVVAPADADEAPGVALRGGVAIGEAVVANTTNSPEHVVGDVVHLAVTLEQNAHAGAVLVNAGIYQATGRVVRYTQVEPSGSLERSSGMLLWQALEPRGRTGAQATERAMPPLVERERELSFLSDVLNRFLRLGEPQFVTVVSEPGLGKSRLVAELGHQVDAASELVGWRVGRTRPYGQGTLGALVEVVKAETGVLDDDDVPTAQRKLHETVAGLLGEHSARVAESLGQLLGVSAEHAPSQAHVVFDDWAEFLAAVAERRPLVLVLEDLQWADEVMLEFVAGLADRIGPVPLLLVATGRPEFLDRAAGWGGGQRNTLTITLSPLSREGTGLLLDALLEGAELPADTRAALLDASGGNPLYVEEYVHMLTGQQPPAAGAGLVMPTSVQQVISARIDTLPNADKQLLQDAAVIGESCFLGQLAAVAGADRDESAAGLRRLERREFLRRLRRSSVAGEPEYAFRHTLIREVAYGQLLRAERADKHQRAAAWLEALSPDPGERVELLAHHYSRALELAQASGRPTDVLAEQARKTLRMAGDRAAGVGSFTTATRAYEAALEVWLADDPERPELLVSLGEALVLGEQAGADVLDQARSAALAHGREDLVAEADARLSWLELARGDWAAAEEHARRGLGGQAPPSATSGLSALANRAVRLMLTDRHTEAIATARQVITLARRHGRPEFEGNGLHITGTTRILSGDLGGLADCEQGIALMEANRYPLRVFSRLSLARALWWYGDLERCTVTLTEGRKLAETTGVDVGHLIDTIQLGPDYVAGRWDAVTATAERVLARQPPDRERALCLIFRGSVALAREQADGALADARAACEAIAPDDIRHRQFALALLGRCLLAAGRREDAVACLERLLADQRERPAESCATPDEALLALDLGYAAEALPDGLAETRWHQAVRSLVTRDFDRAVELLAAIGSEVDLAAARARRNGS